MRFTLKDHGYATYKVIVQGRKTVGRVARCEDGTYIAVIGKTITERASTESAAFRQAASKAMGYDSPEAVQAHNQRVRAVRKVRRQETQSIVDRMLAGNFDPLKELFRK